MAATQKDKVLRGFQEIDEEGSGSVSSEKLLTFLCASLDDKESSAFCEMAKSFAIPGTDGLQIDYIRFTDWCFKTDAWSKEGDESAKINGCGSHGQAPVLAQSLQTLLLAEAPAKKNRPPVVLMDVGTMKNTSKIGARRNNRAGDEISAPPPLFPKDVPESSQQVGKASPRPEGGLQRQCTITGRDIAEAPGKQQLAGVADAEFKPIMTIEEARTGHVLEHFANIIKEDIFDVPFSVSIAIPTIEDTPLIAISQGFTELTGYSQKDIVGRNCRFLLEGVPKDQVQDQTRQEARRYCRAAYLRGLTRLSHTFLIQRNARKNGELFWNLFMLSLVPIPGSQPLIIGLQLDLGPKLDLAEGSDIAAAVEPHAQNLQLVLQMLFGQSFGQRLSQSGGDDENENETDRTPSKRIIRFNELASEMGLASDIKKWVHEAEMSSEYYQEWGTLPWVMWPMTSKYALLNGGTTLLRMEADETPRGGLAMSIFPTKKAPRGCSFKVRIDQVCNFEADVSKGAWIPSLGFTEVTPANMDILGGLPSLIESCAKIICLRGDGTVFARSAEEHWVHGDTPHSAVMERKPISPYALNVGDTLECLWGKGLFEVSAAGDQDPAVIYKIKDSAIPKPPKKPMYAVIGCCYATCKVTLVQ
jgi:hypothetical protein